MNILEQRPELKAILGETGKEKEFQALIKTMSPEELTSLNHYLNKALDDSEVDIWKKTTNVRNVESQIHYLKADYNSIRNKLQLIQKDLRDSFALIYKQPQKAEQKCIKWENTQGLIKTGWTVRNRPTYFGVLRGMSILGVLITSKRKKAKETALLLNYEGMKKTFNEGKKMVTWLGHIVKGV